jgi:hypothetical protein
MTGSKTAQARIFLSTNAEAHETGTNPTEIKKIIRGAGEAPAARQLQPLPLPLR